MGDPIVPQNLSGLKRVTGSQLQEGKVFWDLLEGQPGLSQVLEPLNLNILMCKTGLCGF